MAKVAKVKEVETKGGGVATTADVAARAGITHEEARRFLKAILDEMAIGREVHLTSFGQFRTSGVRGRTVKSPILPGGKVTYKARTVLRFRGSDKANDYLNGTLEGWK